MIDGFAPALGVMFGIGLLGAGHCVGMCGGIASALGFAGDNGATRWVVAYNFGRICSYAVAGGLVASVGAVGANYLAAGPVLRGIAGFLLIGMGCYVAGWWRGLTWLEKGGRVLWRRLQPLGQKVLPVRSTSAAVMLGLVWGWLPCGLVYTALAFAATAASPVAGMAQMAAFGAGTLPAILLAGFASGKLGRRLQSVGFRRVFAVLLVVYGVWTLLAALLPVWLAIFPGHQFH